MKAFESAEYRLKLAEGFLDEALEDYALQRWRSCVDNAQLSIENAGKTVLSLFSVASKTHDPAQPIAALLHSGRISGEAASLVEQILPHLLAFGSAEHMLTDCGDESTGTPPWDLFTEESARDALTSARRCAEVARTLYNVAAGANG